ncbi:hypothetical protein C0Q70_19854 [Pomacea canaliculata]|uniref:Cyclin C-terminal domain-containing protein n=1 Tax=Pomacea canaliculata TaxID=400727 RepID=A0A2T7NDX1_POMCA|nr:hypothetical protein C0Q70_19854 [Pomacea canaliculata]
MHPSCRFCHSLWQNQFQELGQLQGPRNGSDPLAVELQTRQVLGQRAVRGIPNLDRSRETWRDSGVEGDSSAQPRTRRGPCTPPGSQEGALTSLLDAKEEVRTPHLCDVVTACNIPRGQFWQKVKVMERLVLKTLNGRLVVPTPLFFLEEGLKIAKALLEIVVGDYEVMQFRPSLLALATWKVAAEITGADDQDFRPEKMYITRGQFGCCYRKVKEIAVTTHKTDLYDMTSFYSSP